MIFFAAADSGMTLWQLIRAGGGSMILLGLLSAVTVAFIVYFFLYFRETTLAPEPFTRDLADKLAAKKFNLAKELAGTADNAVARITLAAVNRIPHGPVAAREAAEAAAKTEAAKLWENLSYLSDIAVIAPLVGLLGTVLGMIDAFNVIAFESAAVKPVMLAGGIAKAMITTATGLIIAIPASIFYSFFRGRILKITAKLEAFTAEIVDLVSDTERASKR